MWAVVWIDERPGGFRTAFVGDVGGEADRDRDGGSIGGSE
jgi:hypothetical protein